MSRVEISSVRRAYEVSCRARAAESCATASWTKPIRPRGPGPQWVPRRPHPEARTFGVAKGTGPVLRPGGARQHALDRLAPARHADLRDLRGAAHRALPH